MTREIAGPLQKETGGDLVIQHTEKAAKVLNYFFACLQAKLHQVAESKGMLETLATSYC